jgi:hypothetical protein
MKIEVGKSYMTRDGRRADVIRFGDTWSSDFPFYGLVGDDDCTWSDDGRWLGEWHRLDLVAEWYDETRIDDRSAPETNMADTANFAAKWNEDRTAFTVTVSAPEITRQSILEEAIAAVAGRGKSYGRPEDIFEHIARLWTTHLDNRYGTARPDRVELDPQDVAMMMALMKIARLENDPNHHDSWVDIAGYGACGGEIAGRNISATESNSGVDVVSE